MKQFFCLSFLLWICFATSVYAQQSQFEVKGVVLDSLTLQTEPYATVRIFKLPDETTPVSSFVSDEDGRFRSVLSVPGKYFLRITCVGRTPYRKNFSVSPLHPSVDVGKILLQESNDRLDEIEVVAAKPLVKAEIDKTTYNIEDDPDSKTQTLLEILRKVPLVTIDGGDNIQVNGSGSFIVYMNGKRSSMVSNNPKEVLRSIPANSIKKVEVITDPGVRYDAEGVSGVLNIITRGGDFEGYSGNLNTLLLNQVQMYGGYGTLKYGKLSLSANYIFSRYKTKRKADYNRHQFHTPSEAFLQKQSETHIITPGHYGNLEASYEFDTLNLITVSGSLDNGLNKIKSSSLYEMRNAEKEFVYRYTQQRNERQTYGHSSLKADYQHQFRRNSKEMLTLSYQYDYSPNDITHEFSLGDRQGDALSLRYLYPYSRQFNNAKGHEHTVQIDYVNPFRAKHSLEGGLKYIRRNNSSYAVSEKKEQPADPWQSSSFQPFISYKHIQNIMAAYAGYTWNGERAGANAGIRMEHTWQDVTYRERNNSGFTYQATDWIPSLSFSARLNEGQQLRVSYNVRLRRPGISYLNPYVLISGDGLKYGNPDLVSEKHHRVSVVYSYFSACLNVQATALYTVGNDGIGTYQFVDPDGILNRTYGNMMHVSGGGITSYVGYNPVPQITLSMNAILQYLDLRAENAFKEKLPGVHTSGFCGSLFANYTHRFKYGWQLVLSTGCVKPERKVGIEYPLYYFYSGYVSKTLLKERLTIALRGQNFIEPYHIEKTKEVYSDYHSSERTRTFGRTFGITLSYRFGDLKEKVRKVARSIENDDILNSSK